MEVNADHAVDDIEVNRSILEDGVDRNIRRIACRSWPTSVVYQWTVLGPFVLGNDQLSDLYSMMMVVVVMIWPAIQ